LPIFFSALLLYATPVQDPYTTISLIISHVGWLIKQM
jgi:hypothetical protein